jgi:predicted glycosyltransferase
MPYIDVMVGSGGTACRETALCGVPTINFHFWDVQARYLYKKGFPIQILRNNSRIVAATKKLLAAAKDHDDTRQAVARLESPLPAWAKYVEACMKSKF